MNKPHQSPDGQQIKSQHVYNRYTRLWRRVTGAPQPIRRLPSPAAWAGAAAETPPNDGTFPLVRPVNAALVPMPEKAAVTELGVKENPLKPLKVVLVSVWKEKKAVEPGQTGRAAADPRQRYLSASVSAFGLLNGSALQHVFAGDGKGSGLTGDDRLRLTRLNDLDWSNY